MEDFSLANSLRDMITSECNPKIKKILKQIKKAANNGNSYLLTRIDLETAAFFFEENFHRNLVELNSDNNYTPKYEVRINRSEFMASRYAFVDCILDNNVLSDVRWVPPVIDYLLNNGFKVKFVRFAFWSFAIMQINF